MGCCAQIAEQDPSPLETTETAIDMALFQQPPSLNHPQDENKLRVLRSQTHKWFILDPGYRADVLIKQARIRYSNIEDYIKRFVTFNHRKPTLDDLEQLNISDESKHVEIVDPIASDVLIWLHRDFDSKARYQENARAAIQTISRIMTGHNNHIQDVYLVPGYLRRMEIDIPLDIEPIIAQYVDMKSLHISCLDINWNGQNGEGTDVNPCNDAHKEFGQLLMDILDIASTNIGWKCLLVQKYTHGYGESHDDWYLWWFNGNRYSENKDCTVIRFTLHWEVPWVFPSR